MYILAICLGLVLGGIFLIYLVWKNIGDASFQFSVREHTPFQLVHAEENKLIFKTDFPVSNTGKQCGTIMDCFVRPQLPYEQFDKVFVTGKVELQDRPRPDDYFEALIVNANKQIRINVYLTLASADGQDIKNVLSEMVDVPVDIIYQHTGRHIARMDKERLVLSAENIAALTGVKLADRYRKE